MGAASHVNTKQHIGNAVDQYTCVQLMGLNPKSTLCKDHRYFFFEFILLLLAQDVSPS
jgi:hypothetical protein